MGRIDAAFEAGYAAYRRGEKIPIEKAPDHDFALGWWAANEKREKFGPFDSFLAAPEEWHEARDLAVAGWINYFEARLNPDLGEQDNWGPVRRPDWYRYYKLPPWISEVVEIAVAATEATL